MEESSFAAQRSILDEACLFLRSFTLGKRGISQRAGTNGIERVNVQCDRLTELFGTGPFAAQVARIVASARTRVSAAHARLELLAKRR